jgi:hypothetical protein
MAAPLEAKSHKQPRGKKAQPYLPIGLILCNRLKIERLIGGGGFGQVFKAINQVDFEPYFINLSI